MNDLDEFLGERRDGREVKRALCVKLVKGGLSGKKVAEMVGVCPQYVSKWKQIYELGGVGALVLGHRGSAGFLDGEQRNAILTWLENRLSQQSPVGVEILRDEIQERFGVLYRSRQSYYPLLHAAKASYHKTQKQNPRRDEARVLEQRAAIKKTLRANSGDSIG